MRRISILPRRKGNLLGMTAKLSFRIHPFAICPNSIFCSGY
jgi:hypothetical protein